MKVRYRTEARSDLENIYQYLAARNPAGAENVLRAIYAGIQFIAENPLAAPKTTNAGVRVLIVRRYRYKVFYGIDSDAIDVLHIRHTARQPWVSRS
ncbi:MAG TPA: type II toxin-antitoxin system RelE/ParE family toxin [Stellaceae bacterium]